MEKEEESESHLQKVINARQNFNESGKGIVIPIPEATIPVHHYPTVYKVTSTIPSTYIRVPGGTAWFNAVLRCFSRFRIERGHT
jgi:hypothetical protein